MKKVLFGLLLSAFLFQPGKGAIAHATGRVPSHAYLYKFEESYCEIHLCIPNAVRVVVHQEGTAQQLDCFLDDGVPVPQSQVELNEFVNGKTCAQFTGNKFFYQPKSDRYTFMVESAGFVSRVGPGGNVIPTGTLISDSETVIFQPKNAGTLNAITAGIGMPDGKNPKAYTYRYSRNLAYDADIDYPEITEKPVQQ
jgi:hypothetical protein